MQGVGEKDKNTALHSAISVVQYLLAKGASGEHRGTRLATLRRRPRGRENKGRKERGAADSEWYQRGSGSSTQSSRGD